MWSDEAVACRHPMNMIQPRGAARDEGEARAADDVPPALSLAWPSRPADHPAFADHSAWQAAINSCPSARQRSSSQLSLTFSTHRHRSCHSPPCSPDSPALDHVQMLRSYERPCAARCIRSEVRVAVDRFWRSEIGHPKAGGVRRLEDRTAVYTRDDGRVCTYYEHSNTSRLSAESLSET